MLAVHEARHDPLVRLCLTEPTVSSSSSSLQTESDIVAHSAVLLETTQV